VATLGKSANCTSAGRADQGDAVTGGNALGSEQIIRWADKVEDRKFVEISGGTA
jgi:hypothetical protein